MSFLLSRVFVLSRQQVPHFVPFLFFCPVAFFLSRYRPTGLEFLLQPVDFRTLALERLRLPLQISEVACVCGTRLDSRGRHRAACPRSGLLRITATPTQRTLAGVCREAGATVRCNTKLRVSLQYERAIEVVASGLPFHHGAQFSRRHHTA